MVVLYSLEISLKILSFIKNETTYLSLGRHSFGHSFTHHIQRGRCRNLCLGVPYLHCSGHGFSLFFFFLKFNPIPTLVSHPLPWDMHLKDKCLMKGYSASLAIREMQIKTTIRYHFTQVRTASINKSTTTSAGKDVEKREPCWWECRLVQPLWKTV